MKRIYLATLSFIVACVLISCSNISLKEDETPVPLAEATLKEKPPGKIDVDGIIYDLTMEDNFDGDAINSNYWEPLPDGYYITTKESMSWVEDGSLCISADFDENGNFVEGGIRSKGKVEQTYGYFEARILCTKTERVNNAWWMMLGDMNSEENLGVDGAEIDILETTNRSDRNKIAITIHVDGYGDQHKSLSSKPEMGDGFFDQWHTYGFLWTEDDYVFYVDGVKKWSKNRLGICNQPGYMKLTVHGGDSMYTRPEDVPDVMRVDWVRVYSIEREN